jgi:dipeptidase E
MPKAIVAIGGGEIRTRGTAPIDREIIRLSGKKHPKLLFIPTASSDSERYWKHVKEYFGNNGTVLSGISAGSICWFDSGHSDSISFYNAQKWKYINVKGMGLYVGGGNTLLMMRIWRRLGVDKLLKLAYIPGIHCPHYNSMTRGVPRRKHFRDLIRKTGGVGIAIENNCAIEFIDGQFYKVISSRNYSRAYQVYKSGGEVIAEQIRQKRHLAPIESLRDRSRLIPD